MPSTRNPAALPGSDDLRRLSQSLAILDAILCPEWQYRYHSFDARWASGEAMASMRDGCGDGYFLAFSAVGAILKGFVRDSQIGRRADRPVPGLFDPLPPEFARFLDEPAFSIEDSTFCLWRRPIDPCWQVGAAAQADGDDPDGSSGLLRLLDGDPHADRAWAEEYFEVPVAIEIVELIYAHRPLTGEMVEALHPGLDPADLAEIGYAAG